MDVKTDEKRRLQIVNPTGEISEGRSRASEQGNDTKKLLTEVLPDPTARALPGSARQRALDRMTRLVAYAAASAALTAGCRESGTSSGYGVVDPMPVPSRCIGVAAGIKASAAWKQGDGGLVIELTLSKPTQADASYNTTDKPDISGMTVTSVDVKDGAMTLTLTPTAQGASYFWLNIAIACAAGPAHINVNLTPGTASAGAAIPVTLSDQY